MIQQRVRRPPQQFYSNFVSQLLQKDQANHQKVEIIFSSSAIQFPKKLLSKLRRGDKNGNVKFRGEQWQVYNIKEICQYIVQWKIFKGFYIENCKAPQAIQQISNIKFEYLTNLNLANNNIESIQCICALYAPNLQRLVLSQNKITCIKSLRNVNFVNLKSCSFGGNRISEYRSLCQLNAPLLKHCYQELRADTDWCNLFTWIAKLQTNELQRLWVASDNRIWQKKAQMCLERKYRKRKQITFYVGMVNLQG